VLRGVNLGGSSKIPTASPAGFYAWRDVSFVGRPFPLDAADEHFGRLASWGQRIVRLLVSWEGIEHAGPGQYDREYLAYLRGIVHAAGRHGIWVLVDPHQDAWSRWSGGDGAPAWTLTEVGFRLEGLHASGAALLDAGTAAPYPPMVWPTNQNRLACATMFTLFFGGAELAPEVRVRGQNAQEFLQGCYVAAMRELAVALKGLDNVVGFGAMNEPSLGFIGLSDLSRLERAPMRRGLMPSPFEAMRAGAGHPTRCARWTVGLAGQRRVGRGVLNPTGVSAWAHGVECVWKRAGVWDEVGGMPRLLRPGHFRATGDLGDRYLRPFCTRLVREIRSVLPEAVLFAEGVPLAEHPSWAPGEVEPLVDAPHWYDGIALAAKRTFRLLTVESASMKPFVGPAALRRAVSSYLGTQERGPPVVIGEFGVPFDINRRAGYRRGDFAAVTRALSQHYDALDKHLMGATIWNYNADHDALRGDGWNGEDFSVYSRGSGADGGRALLGFCRPYAERIAGIPRLMRFSARRRVFELRFVPEPSIVEPTVIYLPRVQYPRGYSVELSEPESMRVARDEAGQRLLITVAADLPGGREARVVVRPEA
jgi:hypothetical protein